MSDPSLPRPTLAVHFADIPDPRRAHGRDHELLDILVLVVVAILCGADDFTEIEEFGEDCLDWLRTLVPLKNGIPSHDTIGRVFAALDTVVFGEKLTALLRPVAASKGPKHVALDGKTSRASADRNGTARPLHMITAWSTDLGMALAQRAVGEKKNEISELPAIIDMLDLRDAVVTIDAIGCQKAIVEAIGRKKGEYILSLRDNQPNLRADAQLFLDGVDGKTPKAHVFQTVDNDHGPVVIRQYLLCDDLDWLDARTEWDGLRSVGRVRVFIQQDDGPHLQEERLYISSLPAKEVERFARCRRAHWQVENTLHWVLDVAFREDQSRARTKNQQANLAVARRLVVGIMGIEKRKNPRARGVAARRRKAGRNVEYRNSLLANWIDTAE